MSYYFDTYGWYTNSQIPGRFTEIAPNNFNTTDAVGEIRSNFTGVEWIEVPFFNPPIVEPVVEVPQVVSMRQARLSLLNAGLLDDVNTIMMSSSQAIQIDWEYATEVQRQSPLVLSMADTLGLTSAQVDNLFIDAAAL